MTEFKGKKIAILGWGIDTEDIVLYLITKGAHLTVYDQKASLDTKYTHEKIEWKLGSNDFGDLSQYDLIIRNPAVYRYREELVKAEKAGVPISSKTKIFFDLCPCPIVGVTGTKGKGTTSTLIYEILKKSGKDVYLGGNIGSGLFQFLDKLTTKSWVVLELSSFQLIDLHKSPHIAVTLMTTVEHQDWHRSPEEYVTAKFPISNFQFSNDFSIYNIDYPNSLIIGEHGQGGKIKFSTQQKCVPGAYLEKEKLIFEDGRKEEIMSTDDIRLRGQHNLENILAAVAVSKVLGVDVKVIRDTVSSFKGLEHRLEEVGDVGGVRFYNDSFSTTPETTIAAIKSFNEPVILISGGSEKGSNFSQLGKEIAARKNIKAVILIGLMASRIKQAILEAGGVKVKIIEGTRTMAEIVEKAYNMSVPGDVIVLSPGAASFDMFKNYKQRGQLFKEEVLKLKSKPIR